MKNIELTEEHKSKLLEMCKVLFPNMFVPTIQDNGYINYSDSGKTIDYSDKIHWFEFCFNYLCPKIIGEGYSLMVNSFYTQHPIDFLYEWFKI